MKHNSKKFLWCSFSSCKLQVKRTILAMQGKLQKFFCFLKSNQIYWYDTRLGGENNCLRENPRSFYYNKFSVLYLKKSYFLVLQLR